MSSPETISFGRPIWAVDLIVVKRTSRFQFNPPTAILKLHAVPNQIRDVRRRLDYSSG